MICPVRDAEKDQHTSQVVSLATKQGSEYDLSFGVLGACTILLRTLYVGAEMLRKGLFPFIAFAIVLAVIACSDRTGLNSITGTESQTQLAGDASGSVTTYQWKVVNWDGSSAPEANKFYRILDIGKAKEYFSHDEKIISWLESLPQLEEAYSATRDAAEEGEQVINVTVTKSQPKNDGPTLAALTWSASATITTSSGGSVANCSTTTTNPAGVSGLKSHQIWVFNENGWVYFADYWDTEDLLEHTVNFTHNRSVACDSTVRCLGRIVHGSTVKAYDVDTYVRSCN